MLLKFRPDLEISSLEAGEGRTDAIIKDPVTQRFFRLSPYELRFLKALDGKRTVPEAIEALKAAGSYYEPETVKAILDRASKSGLLLGTPLGSAEQQIRLKRHTEQAKKSQKYSQLFFAFIPLVNPDRFLERTLWLFKLIYNKWTAVAFSFAAIGAGYLFLAGLPRMRGQYLVFFNLENLLYLWFAIAFTKLVHEFAHAYVAKSYDIRVPQMGVAFLIFFPCLFCNTTDAWTLADRKQRIAIGIAGILAELALAVLATYVWYFTKPGMASSLAFNQMAVASVSTILFNGNPLIRFDGYFVLSDYLRIPNLMMKARNYVRYWFLNRVLGISKIENPAKTRRESIILALQGIGSFIYRIFLCVSIVIGVYYRFDKTLGIVLGIVAAGVFLIRPALRGVINLHAMRKEVSPRPVGIAVFSLGLAALSFALFMPLASSSLYPCYATSALTQKLTLPLLTSVKESFVRQGSPVKEGDPLFVLDTNQLEVTLLKKRNDRRIVEQEVDLLLVDEKERARAVQKRHQLAKVDYEIACLERDLNLAKAGITAPFGGVVTHLDHRVQDGFQPGEGTVVGEVQSPEKVLVYGVIVEAGLEKVHVGQAVEVWFPIGTGLKLRGTIDHLRPYSEADLKGLPFSSRVGGELAVEPSAGRRQDVPLEAVYLCAIRFDGEAPRLPLGITGRLVVHLPPESIAVRNFQRAVRAFNRESFF